MRITISVLMTVGVLAGCGQRFDLQDYPTPQDLLSASEDLYRRGKCGSAERGFRGVTTQLPVRDTIAVRAKSSRLRVCPRIAFWSVTRMVAWIPRTTAASPKPEHTSVSTVSAST